jgi:uncharacterized membrane protein
MRSRANIYKHPIHPMLIVFPIGLWVFSFVCDLVALNSAADAAVFWSDMSFFTMLGGVIGALAAAVPGFVDYLGLKDRRLKQIATTHMVLNLVIVALYVFNLGLRMNRSVVNFQPVVLLSAIALGLLVVSGWLGGSLVYVHGVAVEEQPGVERKDRAA